VREKTGGADARCGRDPGRRYRHGQSDSGCTSNGGQAARGALQGMRKVREGSGRIGHAAAPLRAWPVFHVS
jgi:hypothetical protein